MSKLEELLQLADEDPKMFDKYVNSIAETIDELPYELLKEKPFTNEFELVAGYQVSYGYRLAKEKLKEKGEITYAEVTVFNIFTFLGEPVNNPDILKTVKKAIMDKLEKRH